MKKQTIYKSETGRKKILDYYESYLPLLQVHFERTYVKTRLGKTHVLITGPPDGKPLFILHGANCINPMTLSWFSSLLQNYRVYAPDTIGQPGYSDEMHIPTKDESFALWISDLLQHFQLEKSAFIGASYGAGILLRLAASSPEKIACAVLVSPCGLQIGPKTKMIRDLLLPLLIFKANSSANQLKKLSDVSSLNRMKAFDRLIMGDIFKHVKLERNIPKLAQKKELVNFVCPTMIVAGSNDILFPEKMVLKKAKSIIPNLRVSRTYHMGHVPAQEDILQIDQDIQAFLKDYY